MGRGRARNFLLYKGIWQLTGYFFRNLDTTERRRSLHNNSSHGGGGGGGGLGLGLGGGGQTNSLLKIVQESRDCTL